MGKEENVNKYIKIIMVIVIFLALANVVSAKNIKFNEKVFRTFFEKRGYKVMEYEDLPPHILEDSVNSPNIVKEYSANKDGNSFDMYVFNSNDDAYNYFKYIYNEMTNGESDKLYNFDRKENANYSYYIITTELRKSYMVNIDNYFIKSNIGVDEDDFIISIYQDMGIIEREGSGALKYIICFFLAIALFVIHLIYGKKKKKII